MAHLGPQNTVVGWGGEVGGESTRENSVGAPGVLLYRKLTHCLDLKFRGNLKCWKRKIKQPKWSVSKINQDL